MKMSPDRFGHWVVAGKKYSNKLQAVIDAVKLGHWIHWDFNESSFKKYNWTQEPVQSLQSLYDERARRIREKYAFVAIEFSGGADSWNMLYAFCRQRLKVDLVIHKYAGETVKGPEDLSAENHWAEGKYQAWGWFTKLKELNPDMQWVTWDIEKPIQDGWRDGPVDFLFHNNLHPGSVIKMPDRANVNPFDIPELPSTAYLFGIDKPIVELYPDGWYLTFYDNHIISRSVIERNMLGLGWDDLLFYWDPDCVPLMIKQAHTIMNFFRKNPGHSELLKKAGPRGWNYKNFIISLIYPEYRAVWQSDKPQGTFAFTNENWFISHIQNSASTQWHETLNQYSDLLLNITEGTPFRQYINQDAGAANYNVFADCPSHHYYLGPV